MGDESAMEAEKYIIYRQTSQSVLYNMERDDTVEEQEVVKEDTVEETTDRVELFTIREETSYDDLDAVFQKIYERDIYEFNSLDDIKEENDIEEMKPVFSKPFIPSRPITPKTPVIKKPVINTPVINTPISPRTPVNIPITVENTQNILKSESEVEEVEDIIPFFSKPFSPDAVKKWNVMISKKQSIPVEFDQEFD